VTAYTPALDGVRGIAILLVLVHHFTVFDPSTTFGAWLQFTALLGWCGVDLFFVLSGFLITGILIDARGSPRYFSSFYMRRSLRIFPLYFLVVFLSFVVLPLFPRLSILLVGPTPVPQWPYWIYLVNFAIAERNQFIHGILDIAWSLAIEEQFYIVWAAVVWLLSPRLLGPLCALIVVTAAVLRTLAIDQGAEPIAVYVLPHFRADSLALGGLLAWLARRALLTPLRRVSPTWVVAAALGAVAIAVSEESPWWWEPWTQRVGYSLLALAGGGLVVAAVTRPSQSLWQRALSASWLRACGKYSYCMYLIHLPISRLLQEFVISAEDFPALLGAVWPAQVGYYVVASGLTFAVAWVSWRTFEAPILRLKARFPYAEVQAVSAP
jgi:peptidoglycan/LPS O-acetylase OafA/YrhL